MATYSTTNAPLPYVEPYLRDYLSRAYDVSNAPYEQSPGTYVGPNSYLTGAWQATANRAMNGSPVMSAANDTMQKAVSGGFMGSNPYLDSQIQSAQGDLVKSWNMVQKPAWDKAMQASGSFGNTGIMEAQGNAASDLQKNLGRISSDIRNNAYNSGLSFMGQAMSMAPTYANQDYQDIQQLTNAGTQQQAFQSAQQNQNQQWWQEAQNFPMQRIGFMGQALGVGGQGQTSTQTAPDPSKLSTALGGGLTGAAIYKLLLGGP